MKIARIMKYDLFNVIGEGGTRQSVHSVFHGNLTNAITSVGSDTENYV